MMARLIDRLAFVVTAAIFCAAIFVLIREFGGVSLHEVLARLAAMPVQRIAAAAGLTAVSYLLLTGYDYLALRYARHRLPFRDVVFASFTAFALSNNVGFHILSGGSVRYRVYSRLGLNAVAVGEVVAFCSFAYALGVVTVGGLLALVRRRRVCLDPAPAASAGHGGRHGAAGGRPWLSGDRGALAPADHALALPAAAAVVAAGRGAGGAGLGRRGAGGGGHVCPAAARSGPRLSTLPRRLYDRGNGFHFSLVPGGLGVFETAVTIMTASPSKAATLSVFFVYRLIYFILPLLVALAWSVLRNVRRRE